MQKLSHRFTPIEFSELANSDLSSVDVAVIDSGVNATHNAFRSLPISKQFCVNDDGVQTLSKLTNNDPVGHGTAVAGIIHSIAPNARIFDLRVVNTGTGKTAPNLIKALEYCLEQGIKVINLSLAVSAKYQNKLQAINEKANRSGQIIIAAQRNYPDQDYGFPAELAYSISVNNARFDSPYQTNYQSGKVSPFIANGINVVAPLRTGGYKAVTGTSFATPTISGLCALLLGKEPELESFEIKSILKWNSQGSNV